MDGGDICMVERGQHLGFAFETCQALRITHEGFRQELQGNSTVQFEIAGEVNLTHRAFADFLSD
jgi:hypothetical protein